VTLNFVLGDGEMTKRELLSTLDDLWEADAGENFWFIIQGKSEPTDTDRALVNWLETNDIYFEVVTDVADSMDELYGNASEVNAAKKLSTKVLSLLNSKPEGGEDAKVLSLFVSNDDQLEEDRWLLATLEAVCDNGNQVFALNDGMVELEFGSTSGETEEEEEAPPPKATPAKKASAAPPSDDEEDEEAEEEGDGGGNYTREQLEELALPELKKIASSMGIELPPRTRITTYVEHILGGAVEEEEEAAAEVADIRGGWKDALQFEEIVEAVIAALVEKLQS
jgi:pyruvate/2-oxoglutarate dehydrogenase complex dihydrolipoamide acyltransferase (E2) component